MFILRQTSVKMAVLLHKQAKVPYSFSVTVSELQKYRIKLETLLTRMQVIEELTAFPSLAKKYVNFLTLAQVFFDIRRIEKRVGET